MALNIDPETILHETDLEQVEYRLLHYAEQMAVLGAIETARALIALFNRKSITGSYRHFLRPLAFAWNETGLWPDGSSSERKSQAFLEDLRSKYNEDFWGGFFAVPEDLQTMDEKGLAACLDFSIGVDPFTCRPDLPAVFYENGPAASERLVKALDISLQLSGQSIGAVEDLESSNVGQDDQDEPSGFRSDEGSGWVNISYLDKQSSEILSRIVQRWDKRDQVTALTRAERLWPLFITGAVADAMGLSRAELDAKAKVILDTFTQRLDAPYAKTALDGKDFKELLEVGDEYTTRGSSAAIWFREMGDLDETHDDRPATLFKDPATNDMVNALEEKLACTLPSDYKEFLLVTNGFFYDKYDGMYNGYCPGPALYGTEGLHWEDEDYWHLPLELLQIPRDIEQLGDVEEKGEEHMKWNTSLPMIDRVLVIGRRDTRHLFLISPDQVAKARKAYYTMHRRADLKQKEIIERAIEAFAGSMEAFDNLEWACLFWISSGGASMTSYPSFRRYLEIAATDSMKEDDDL